MAPCPSRDGGGGVLVTSSSSEDELARMMAEADADGDGFINLDVFAALNATVAGDAAAVEEDLRHAFWVFDADGNSTISATEDELTRMMAEADADSDGFISLDEFAALNATAAGDAATVEEDLHHAFWVFDANGNSTISAAELARMLRGLGHSASVVQCHRMIEGVDQNGDGLILFEEFKVMMAGGGGFSNMA